MTTELHFQPGADREYVRILHREYRGEEVTDATIDRCLTYMRQHGAYALVLAVAGTRAAREYQVENLYQELLGRESDPEGLAAWSGGVLTLSQIREAFFASPEFQSKVKPPATTPPGPIVPDPNAPPPVVPPL